MSILAFGFLSTSHVVIDMRFHQSEMLISWICLCEYLLQGDSLWKLAEVRANRQNAKGTKLTRKQAAQRFEIPLKSLLSVKLYVDF